MKRFEMNERTSTREETKPPKIYFPPKSYKSCQKCFQFFLSVQSKNGMFFRATTDEKMSERAARGAWQGHETRSSPFFFF